VELTLASYNIHRGIGRAGHFDADAILTVLRELEADIIALQEVESPTESGLEFLETMAAEIGFHATAGTTLVRGLCRYGNALLSRTPPEWVLHHDISVGRREPRGVLEAWFTREGLPLRVLVTHFGLRARERWQQFHALMRLADQTPEVPLALLGDFNEWWLFSTLTRRLRRRFGAIAAPRTFPAVLPLLPLDRIWVQPPLRMERVTAHRSPAARRASDHLPLRAVVTLSGSAPPHPPPPAATADGSPERPPPGAV